MAASMQAGRKVLTVSCRPDLMRQEALRPRGRRAFSFQGQECHADETYLSLDTLYPQPPERQIVGQ